MRTFCTGTNLHKLQILEIQLTVYAVSVRTLTRFLYDLIKFINSLLKKNCYRIKIPCPSVKSFKQRVS